MNRSQPPQYCQQSLAYLQAMGIDYWQRRAQSSQNTHQSAGSLANFQQIGIVGTKLWILSEPLQTPAERRLLTAIGLAVGERGDEILHQVCSLQEDQVSLGQKIQNTDFIFIFGEKSAAQVSNQFDQHAPFVVLPSLAAMLSHPLLKKTLWQQVLNYVNHRVKHGTK